MMQTTGNLTELLLSPRVDVVLKDTFVCSVSPNNAHKDEMYFTGRRIVDASILINKQTSVSFDFNFENIYEKNSRLVWTNAYKVISLQNTAEEINSIQILYWSLQLYM